MACERQDEDLEAASFTYKIVGMRSVWWPPGQVMPVVQGCLIVVKSQLSMLGAFFGLISGNLHTVHWQGMLSASY
jgi:hypothetical protein